MRCGASPPPPPDEREVAEEQQTEEDQRADTQGLEPLRPFADRVPEEPADPHHPIRPCQSGEKGDQGEPAGRQTQRAGQGRGNRREAREELGRGQRDESMMPQRAVDLPQAFIWVRREPAEESENTSSLPSPQRKPGHVRCHRRQRSREQHDRQQCLSLGRESAARDRNRYGGELQADLVQKVLTKTSRSPKRASALGSNTAPLPLQNHPPEQSPSRRRAGSATTPADTVRRKGAYFSFRLGPGADRVP